MNKLLIAIDYCYWLHTFSSYIFYFPRSSVLLASYFSKKHIISYSRTHWNSLFKML